MINLCDTLHADAHTVHEVCVTLHKMPVHACGTLGTHDDARGCSPPFLVGHVPRVPQDDEAGAEGRRRPGERGAADAGRLPVRDDTCIRPGGSSADV